ncbi:hypothetical protein HDU79_008419 [Rhizoclosmatium sp. JEL0117]|nr:hypothetical protein HDU79_008419 [Rhizoclosmatium sp. JEL0117]
MPAPSTMHNDDDYSSILSSEDMDSDLDSSNTSFELTIDGAVDYATELHNERTAPGYTPSEYDYRHGIKRSWEEEDDDLDATEQVVYHSTGEYLAVQAPEGILSPLSDSIPSLATGNVYLDAALDAESARSIHQVLGGIGLASSAAEGCTPFLHSAGIINDIDEDFDEDDDEDDAMSVLGSAAAIAESCDLPRKRVRAI